MSQQIIELNLSAYLSGDSGSMLFLLDMLVNALASFVVLRGPTLQFYLILLIVVFTLLDLRFDSLDLLIYQSCCSVDLLVSWVFSCVYLRNKGFL